jgi:ribosomal protein L11 methylase PrmA
MTAPVSVPGARSIYVSQRAALVELEPGYTGRPEAISARLPGVRRVIDFGTGSGALAAANAALARRIAPRA